MAPGQITSEGGDARTDGRIEQEVLPEGFPCIQPKARDGIA